MLILQTTRDALLKPLQSVTNIVERRHTFPILANVLIKCQNGQLDILATDNEVQTQTYTPSPADDTKAFYFTVNAQKLQDILRSLPDENTPVSFDLDDHMLTIKAGKSRFTLQTLPVDDFPTIKITDEGKIAFSVEQDILKNMITQVHYSMALQDIRFYLNGLLLQVDGNQLNLVATDGHRLALARTTIEGDFPKKDMILPRKTVLELNKLLNQQKNPVHIELLEKHVCFHYGNNMITSKVIDGNFPDYQRVIPLDNNKIIQINRLQLLNALERSAILAHEKVRGVYLKISPNTLRVVCTNGEQEEAQEELEIVYEGEAFEESFNINYLTDALRNVDHENIQIAFGNTSRSTLITIPDNNQFKYVVMPLRI